MIGEDARSHPQRKNNRVSKLRAQTPFTTRSRKRKKFFQTSNISFWPINSSRTCEPRQLQHLEGINPLPCLPSYITINLFQFHPFDNVFLPEAPIADTHSGRLLSDGLRRRKSETILLLWKGKRLPCVDDSEVSLNIYLLGRRIFWRRTVLPGCSM
ncbi:unnamed protein product [Sphenostylis stenocarpa]|uniref:Uncharacterized protein n=1 Tax=Sphenostylis stenocarpa TaxID=92480 RepID=A0AA86W286_9FABA|nr:unnamed protein product [Sphenostylis stenocarpa]